MTMTERDESRVWQRKRKKRGRERGREEGRIRERVNRGKGERERTLDKKGKKGEKIGTRLRRKGKFERQEKKRKGGEGSDKISKTNQLHHFFNFQ